MSQRGKRSRRSNKAVAYIAAGLVHVAILGALFVNITREKPEVIEAANADKVDVVRATTVDQAELKKHQELLKQQDSEKERQKELEQQRIKELQAKAEQEKQKIEDLKKQQEQEKEKAAELQKEREALALKRKEEEEQREKELAEQKKKEDEEAERKKKLAEEQKRKEELAQQLKEQQNAEMQKQLQEQLAAEEAFLAEQISKERTTTLVSKHMALIGQQIKAALRLDPGTESWRKSLVNIKVSPSGDVQSVRTIESSGSLQYDRAVETAVFKASPLPIPDAEANPQVNRQFLDFDFIVKAVE
ncbi:MAG: TonB family protein [Acidiferrobacterales bacterium]|nr:TonB family protein [Acidiferrobacterales bacterium]